MAADGHLNFDTKIDTADFDKAVKQMGASSEKGLNIIKGAIAGVAIATAAVGTAIIGAGFKFNSEMEQYQAGFETLLGSADKADKMLGNLKNFAAKTPFELSDLAKGSQTLLAFGMDADSIMPTLKMLGDVSLGNKDKFNSLTLSFAQVQSTGRLMGQDLLQMVGQGFNPLQIMSEKTGKSMRELKEDMEKGAISSDMVTEAFKSATSEGGRFYNSMEKQSKTMEGQWSTIKDNFSQFSGKILKPVTDYISGTLLPKANELIATFSEKFDTINWQQFKDTLYYISLILVPLIAGFIAFKTVIAIQSIISAVTLSFAALNAVLLANPIVLIITLIVALVAGIMYLWVTNEDFRNFIIGVFTTIGKFFYELWNGIINFFTEDIPNAIGSVINFFKKLPEYIGFMVGFILGLFVMFFLGLWDFATVKIPNFIGKVIQFFMELPSKIWNAIISAKDRLIEWVANLINTSKTEIPKFIDNVINGFKELPNKMLDIGKNIVTGMWNGITGMAGWIKDRIKEFATGVVNGMKTALGIHSPSKVFEKEVGKNIALGVGSGFTKNLKSVYLDMQSAINTETSKINANIDGNLTSNILNKTVVVDNLLDKNISITEVTNLDGRKISNNTNNYSLRRKVAFGI